MTGEQDSGTWDRRAFLQLTGAAAGAGLLAGCSEVTDQEFVADAVVLPEDDQEALGFAPVAERTERREFSETVGGQDVTATVESAVSVYVSADVDIDFTTETGTATGTATNGTGSVDDVSAETLSGGQLSVGVLSTPAATIAGESLNPLARLGLADLLTSDQAESFLTAAGVGEGDGVDWQRGPTELSTAEGTLLEQDVTVETHAGVISGETPNATYLHMARVENDNSVVIAVGIQSFDVEDTSKELVGPDGYMSESELEEARSTVVGVDEALVVE
ncbi:DUF6517 family protein [Haloarcula laminariae]|uniref:DUF6517 family protein n=1 Tax=Haloarcula laminariae TaxID=2961577 RepID=UPI002405CB05|nr:DUF6517 family protein [Halomicroarcula sp. FL173]